MTNIPSNTQITAARFARSTCKLPNRRRRIAWRLYLSIVQEWTPNTLQEAAGIPVSRNILYSKVSRSLGFFVRNKIFCCYTTQHMSACGTECGGVGQHILNVKENTNRHRIAFLQIFTASLLIIFKVYNWCTRCTKVVTDFDSDRVKWVIA